MKNLKLILAVFTFSSLSLAVSAQKYVIDPGHTAITSKVMRFGVVKVVGRFNDVSGNINYDASDITKTTAEIMVKAESYTANNIEGEKAIKSKAFLDAAVFPEISFVIKSITKGENGIKVVADIKLHGVTKEAAFVATINGPALDLPTNKQSIGISAMFTIDRQDFGMRMAAKLPTGGMVVGNEVEIEINALAIAQ